MNWPQNGITENVSFADYRSDDITNQDDKTTVAGKSVSKSSMISFAKDPRAWKFAPEREETAAMRTGSLFDCLLTDSESFMDRYSVSEFDSFRTKESKEWRAAIEESGKSVITKADLESANDMIAAVNSHRAARKLLKGAKFQVAWRHERKCGFASKGLVDLVPADLHCLVDIKTCEPGALKSRRDLAKHIAKWEYHIQAGCYLSGWNIADGRGIDDEITRFKFIFVTSKPPYRVAVVELPLSAILFGADCYSSAVKRFSECMETNHWPSIWDNEIELDLPAYAYETES